MSEYNPFESDELEPPKPSPVSKTESDLWRRRIGAFWVKEGRGGQYLSGEISLEKITGRKETVRVNILKNPSKGMAKHPDYELFLQREEVAKDILNG